MTATELPVDLAAKRDRLLTILREMGSVAVAFSGGIDSTVVAVAAQKVLSDRAFAITADSPSVARSELADAQRIAREFGLRHKIVATEEFDDPNYVRNDGSRCYFCKSELYDTIARLVPTLDVAYVCSGANLDDEGDYRPGLVAAREHAVRHPLQEAGFAKSDVRTLARHWGLPTWDKPAAPCLSSRLAPGVEVTVERTARVEAAEALLKGMGLRECRVRLHEGELARIEVPTAAIAHLAQPDQQGKLAAGLKELGFRFVTLDLEGLRTGSMNDLISVDVKRRYQQAGEGTEQS